MDQCGILTDFGGGQSASRCRAVVVLRDGCPARNLSIQDASPAEHLMSSQQQVYGQLPRHWPPETPHRNRNKHCSASPQKLCSQTGVQHEMLAARCINVTAHRACFASATVQSSKGQPSTWFKPQRQPASETRHHQALTARQGRIRRRSLVLKWNARLCRSRPRSSGTGRSARSSWFCPSPGIRTLCTLCTAGAWYTRTWRAQSLRRCPR